MTAPLSSHASLVARHILCGVCWQKKAALWPATPHRIPLSFPSGLKALAADLGTLRLPDPKRRSWTCIELRNDSQSSQAVCLEVQVDDADQRPVWKFSGLLVQLTQALGEGCG